jgi:uncharacterized protein YjbI with pentapeptide repeats
MPLGVLLLMEWVFLPYQGATSWLHAAAVTVDLTMMVFFLAWLPARAGRAKLAHGGTRDHAWSRVWQGIEHGLLLVVAAASVCGAWTMPRQEEWRRLVVRGRLLVAKEPAPELMAALLAEGELERAEILRLFSRGLDLSGRSLRNADFTGSDLYDVKLRGADLTGAILEGADLSGADLNPLGIESWSGARLAVGGDARRTRLGELNNEGFEPTILEGAHLARVVLERAELLRARLAGTDLRESRLATVQLSGADLRTAQLDGADLRAADLYAAKLQGASLVETRLQAASLEEARLIGADLTEARLAAADLERAHLELAVFLGADLQAANLLDAFTFGADLRGAHMQRVSGLYPQGAVLRGVQGRGADLCTIHASALASAAQGEGEGEDVAVTLADLGDWREDEPFGVAGTWKEDLDAGGQLVQDAAQRIELARAREDAETPTCKPAAAPGTDAKPAWVLLGGEAPDQLARFYDALAAQLVDRACGGGSAAADLASAMARAVVEKDALRIDLWRRLRRELKPVLAGGETACTVFSELPPPLRRALQETLAEPP